MRTRLTYAASAGALAVVTYVSLAVASYAHYPTAFNPRDNWLSDLGNVSLNPSGALLYRLDAILVGVLLAVFFLGFGFMASKQETRVRIFLFLAQLCGSIAAGALILTGIFSEGTHASHSFWSVVLYIAFGTAVFLSGWAFLHYPGFPRSLSYFAFSVTVLDWIMAAFNKTYFLEWIMVALLLLYVGIVSYRMIVISARISAASPAPA
jgi:hypothetical protein